MLAFGDAGRSAQVLDARVGAGSDEDAIDGNRFNRGSGGETHIGESLFNGSPIGLLGEALARGDASRNGSDHAGIRPPGDEGGERDGIDFDDTIKVRAGVGRQRPPMGNGRVPIFPFGSEAAALNVGEGRVVGSNESGARARLDAPVSEGHAAFHRERADGIACVFDDVAGCAIGADLANDAERQIFGGHAFG
jgi:hypothetical protein